MIESKLFIIKLFSFILLINLINSIDTALNTECNHLSPFMWNKLPLSVDLAKLNLFPDREDFFASNGFKDRIFNLTCSQNAKFELPNLIIKGENVTYYLPDQMSARAYQHADSMDFSRLIINRTFESDEESYKKNMMNILRVNSLDEEEKTILQSLGYNTSDVDSLFVGAFKLSNNYQRIRKERLANARIATESRLNITAYYIDLNETKMTLTNAFLHEIRSLPLVYEDSISSYEALISTFGTHYFQYFVVGGLAKTSFKLLTESPVPNPPLGDDEFKNDKPFAMDLSGLTFNVDENFGSNEIFFLSDGKIHKRTINFYGGQIGVQNHTLAKWKPSALLDPWVIGGGLAPLSRLIKDKQKKRNFLRAMMAYLDKSEILNLLETVYHLQEYNEKEKWFENYRLKINDLNERKFINHTQLISLSSQFNDDVNVDTNKRQMYGNPIPLWTSNLDEMDKQNAVKIKSSSNNHLISFYLVILLFVLDLIRFKIH